MQPTRGRGKHVHGHRLVENSTEGVALFDEQGRMAYCNRASEIILGCKLEDLVGRAIVDFVHADDRRIINSVLQQCMEKPGEPVATRVRMYYGNGSYRLLDGVFNNLLNDPDIEAIVCNYRDVTRIVAAESGWRESEERFAKAFRTCPVAFTMATQAEARYLDVNDAFLEMLDYDRDEVIGRTAIDLNIWVEPQDRARMLQHLAESRIARGLRTKLRTARGEIRDVTVSAELVEVEGAPCVLAIIQDLTEVMQLEDRFRQAQKIEAVGRLASGVAHDFNNLLGVIMGYSELSLQHLGPDSAVSRNLVRIKMAADRAAGLTRQLLAFSRKQVLYPRVLDLNKLVTNLSEMVLRMIREDVSLSFSPASQPPRVKADPGQIDQILMNLIVNAQDAMPNGGKITIRTSIVDLDETSVALNGPVSPGRYVALSVTDTGCGMDRGTLSHIFEPFYTTKEPGQGTGLGLSTVYGIVRQSGGHIWVYSEPGVGTTFRLYFPYCEEDAEIPAPQRVEESEPRRGSETILLVEDDQSVRDLTADLLESGGYRVLRAVDAVQAIGLLEELKEPVHLLLTDVLMPTMSGGDLSTRVKTLRPDLNVLLMSGYAGDLVTRCGGIKPELQLLEKPFTRRKLLSTVDAIIHNSGTNGRGTSLDVN